MKNFNYHQSSEIVFGSGRVAEAGEIVLKYGKRCLMVTTPEEALKPLYERVKKILTGAGVEVAHFDGVIPNPTTET
ncbi:MAG: iron-containing alcohol dehydrogenase, partial [Cyclobacteriaceae bacterium]|nr:iron-containing alcohol dehydrogenase [Cyclobacteriaceae bacterium]